MSKVMYKSIASYVYCRAGIYYYTRRVPYDVRQHYASNRLSFSLRTKSNAGALRAARSVTQRLEDYWPVSYLTFLAVNNVTESFLIRLANPYWVLFLVAALNLPRLIQQRKAAVRAGPAVQGWLHSPNSLETLVGDWK